MLKKVMSLLLIMNIFIVNDLIKNKDINYISLQTSYPVATKVNEVIFKNTSQHVIILLLLHLIIKPTIYKTRHSQIHILQIQSKLKI